jgi:hypothetical protein
LRLSVRFLREVDIEPVGGIAVGDVRNIVLGDESFWLIKRLSHWRLHRVVEGKSR